jgi:hypothetical protein
MKKIVPLLLVLAVVGGIWFYSTNRQTAGNTTTALSNGAGSATGSSSSSQVPGQAASTPGQTSSGVTNRPQDIDEAEPISDIKPATEAYSSADDALAAVLKAAKDYDDSILEQFTRPGNSCAWCPDFYRSVKDLITAGDTPADQKSYLAEVLAISGRVENVQGLVEAVKSAKTSDEADIFSEALELSVGGDDVTRYLGEQMSSSNETLRESSVAAITNQGSLTAAELLIKHTIERGDPDGYYSLGIGLGEFIPEEEAIPVLQDLMQKHDQYSHLAVKALINSGMDGLRTVFDQLELSTDPEADRRMLKDAIDHVNFEDGLEDYLKQKIETSKQPAAQELAKRILEEYGQEGAEGEETEAPMSTADGEQP